VCGSPGTGKTLSVKELIRQILQWRDTTGALPYVSHINCMSKSPREIFADILMSIRVQTGTSKAICAIGTERGVEADALRQAVKGLETSLIIILDEVDRLGSKGEQILCELFSISCERSSRCVVLSLANTTSLSDSLLARLNGRDCKPCMVNFPAYSGRQLKKLLTQKAVRVPYENIIDNSALQLCAKKIAATTGDMRRALSFCSEAIDRQTKESSTATVVCEHISIEHMVSAVKQLSNTDVENIVKLLPQQTHFIICAALKQNHHSRFTKNIPLVELLETYNTFCTRAAISGLNACDFLDACSTLSDYGIFGISGAQDPWRQKIHLCVSRDVLLNALRDKQKMISKVLKLV